ncbi:MAG: hypothetical protein KGL39_09475, partial [Patescibacteria group bacterium]|nr:hypothetical protein [Patescibacteria group bacterium]
SIPHSIIHFGDPVIVRDFLTVCEENVESLCAYAAEGGHISALRVLLAYAKDEITAGRCMEWAAAEGQTKTMRMLRDEFGAAPPVRLEGLPVKSQQLIAEWQS